jgi:hypothetical protein
MIRSARRRSSSDVNIPFMTGPRSRPNKGPFRADQVTPEDRYEISDGHPVYCAPAGGRHGGANTIGALPLATDPAVTEVGIDVGYTPSPDVLRAPDLAVGHVPDAPGWVEGAPPLAVEYADTGTDEVNLMAKVQQLLTAGTRWIWVVRLVGPRRVEVHTQSEAPRLVYPGQQIHAPGVLSQPMPVEALWDRTAALDVTFRNLLLRHGYPTLEAVRAEGHTEGRNKGRTEGHIEGRTEGVAALLTHAYSRRLNRPLTPAEQTTLLARLDTHGPTRLGDVVLDLASDAIAAWLADPDAR